MIAGPIERTGWFFHPADVVGGDCFAECNGLLRRVGGVAIHVEGDVRADGVPDGGGVAGVGFQAKARLQLHGGIAGGCVALGFEHQLAGVLGVGPALAAEEAGGVGAHLRAHVAALGVPSRPATDWPNA